MADQLNAIGRRKPMFEPNHEKPEKLKTKAEEQTAEKKHFSDADRVSLDQTPKTDQTYGPIPGVEVGTAYHLLRSLVIKTLTDQGADIQLDTGSESLDLNKLTPEKAQELVSEDGYFGVEQTSERIVEFAINAFGNDPTRLEEMRAAIEGGFQEAAGAFGSSLPEISHQTYDTIMEKLERFAGLDEKKDST